MKLKGGVIFYHKHNGKIYVLLVKSSNPKFGGSNFQIPKGCIEDEETVFNSAIREASEETGVRHRDLSDYHYLNTYNIKDYLLTIFYCHTGCKIPSQPDYEVSQRMWVELNRAIKIIRPRQKHIMRDFRNRVL